MSSSTVVSTVAERVSEEVKAAEKHARLPTNVVPSHYEVELWPDLAAAAFSATVKISIDVKSATKTVVLNAAELVVAKATVVCADGAARTSESVTCNEADEVITLTFASELPVGPATLEMSYTGILNDQMRGFYLSKYKDESGVERFLGTTQFEATDCRRAIPSWDEPAIKATFTVSLVCATGLTALSNMPTTHSTVLADNPKLTRHVFDKSVPMSTYLLAFIVGEFDMIEGVSAEGTLVRCFATPGKGEQNRFALDFALQLLPFYSRWFEIPYALPKLDMVAVPDFAAGAMENWGLITYREAALLLDPAHSSAQTKQWVAVCVAHEIAHQWFGNLVTMEWWTHLWLNEGWATWMENYAVNAFFPEFKMWEQFVYSDLNTSFDLDSLHSSHPIEVPINHASEVDEIFDTISYSKGCVAIRMLEGLMGAEPFRRATVAYVKQFAYKNALTADLWAAMSKEKGIDVSSIMNAWTTQTGFPILDLQENDSADPRVLSFKVTQSRFLQDGPAKTAETWPVPVSFLISGQKAGAGVAVGEQLFSAKEGVLTVQLPAASFDKGSDAAGFWVKLNAGQLGMYRIRYPPKMFAALCKAVADKDPLLSPADRLGVQSDAFALARCGLLSTVQLLQLVESYSTETEYTVWADLLANLSDISVLLQPQPATYALFSAFMNRLLARILAQIGWDKKADEEHTVSLLRAKIIGVSGKYGERATIQTGLQKYTAFLASGQALGGKDADEEKSAAASASASSSSSPASSKSSVSLSPDLRSAVYGMVVSHGGRFGYEAMLYQHAQVTMSEESVRCLQALAASTDPELLQRTLDYALSTVRTQDGPSLISAVAANRVGLQLTWSWLQANWPAILVKWTQSSSLSRIVSALSSLTTRQSQQQVTAFFDSHAHPGAERAVKQAIERIESNVKWIERDYAATSEWLSQQQLEADAKKKQQQ